MTNPMTPTELAMLEEIEKKATAAPWISNTHRKDSISVSGRCDTIECAVYSDLANFETTRQTDDDGRVWECSGDTRSNRDFIVMLRNAAPSLISTARESERLSIKLEAEQARSAKLVENRDHWRRNHTEMVARNKLLRTRTDLPLDRKEIADSWEQRTNLAEQLEAATRHSDLRRLRWNQ